MTIHDFEATVADLAYLKGKLYNAQQEHLEFLETMQELSILQEETFQAKLEFMRGVDTIVNEPDYANRKELWRRLQEENA